MYIKTKKKIRWRSVQNDPSSPLTLIDIGNYIFVSPVDNNYQRNQLKDLNFFCELYKLFCESEAPFNKIEKAFYPSYIKSFLYSFIYLFKNKPFLVIFRLLKYRAALLYSCIYHKRKYYNFCEKN